MRTRVVISLLVAGAITSGACSSDTAATTTTTTTAATTTTTTKATTTTTTAATTTTIDASKLKSNDPVAQALDKSIVSLAELKQSGIQAPITDYVELPVPTQGPINLDGLVVALTSEVYRDPLKKGEASVGAQHVYQAKLGSQDGPAFSILAIKFATAESGAKFVQDATQIATVVAGGKLEPLSGKEKIGVLDPAVLRVPPSGQGTTETTVIAALYENGVYYLCAIVSAPNTVTGDAMYDFLSGQNLKYQAVKDSLGLG